MALRTVNKQEYARLTQTLVQDLQRCKQQASMSVLNTLKLEPALFDKSAFTVSQSPERQLQVKTEGCALEVNERLKLLPADY